VAYDARVSSARTFADVLAANETYPNGFPLRGLQARAAKGLAVLTCIDSRIEPLAMLGLRPGDAKILRNAGARVTDDVLRTLVFASYLLGVDRAMVIAHTDCRMATGSEDDVHAAVSEAGGPDTRSLAFLITSDQKATVRADVQRIRSWPYLAHLHVGRIPVRHRHRPPQPPLLNGATSRSPTRWKALARTLRDLLDSP
jgi:carbonic anhydrase